MKALEFFPCARGSGDVVTGWYEKGNEPPAHDPRSPGKEDPHAYTLPKGAACNYHDGAGQLRVISGSRRSFMDNQRGGMLRLRQRRGNCRRLRI